MVHVRLSSEKGKGIRVSYRAGRPDGTRPPITMFRNERGLQHDLNSNDAKTSRPQSLNRNLIRSHESNLIRATKSPKKEKKNILVSTSSTSPMRIPAITQPARQPRATCDEPEASRRIKCTYQNIFNSLFYDEIVMHLGDKATLKPSGCFAGIDRFADHRNPSPTEPLIVFGQPVISHQSDRSSTLSLIECNM
jgi:hypothetical protein